MYLKSELQGMAEKSFMFAAATLWNDLPNSELQITIRNKNMILPCPKRGDVTHALSEARG